MADYLEVVRKLPAPSEAQIVAFVEYVARAHSWYKHLPVDPPGNPFYFVLDPNAGCELRIGPFGTANFRPRTASDAEFHYQSVSTDDYRARFGYLQFFTASGTWVLHGDSEGVLCTRSPGPAIFVGVEPTKRQGGGLFANLARRFRNRGVKRVPQDVLTGQSVMKSFGPPVEYLSSEGWIVVPDELLTAGCVHLTAAIHHTTARVANTMPEDKGPAVERALIFERQQQKDLVVKAIRCVVKLVHG